MPTIPPREPVGDAFEGVILRAGTFTLLSPAAAAGAEVFASGLFVVRYGLRFLGKTFRSIVPELVAIDYGTFLNGAAAWEFLLRRSNLYPRAEVFGHRDDGSDDQAFVRQLDLALLPQVLLYADSSAWLPIARPAAFLGDISAQPERLSAYLPHYDTLTAWEAAQAHD